MAMVFVCSDIHVLARRGVEAEAFRFISGQQSVFVSPLTVQREPVNYRATLGYRLRPPTPYALVIITAMQMTCYPSQA